MCGCFTRHRSWAEIHACLNLIGPAINLQARYNIAPSQEAGVVRAEAGDDARTTSKAIGRWRKVQGKGTGKPVAVREFRIAKRQPRPMPTDR